MSDLVKEKSLFVWENSLRILYCIANNLVTFNEKMFWNVHMTCVYSHMCIDKINKLQHGWAMQNRIKKMAR
jgi:hypothetical protein